MIESKLNDTFHKWPQHSVTADLGMKLEFCIHHPLSETARNKLAIQKRSEYEKTAQVADQLVGQK